ncbi:hypothetical protein KXR63_10840 [Stutzerimonas chloritidismutans]|uniref:hypothetical protein n=1 Tax=Stutzerimonas chloritidismutans TaxID=203192 RepID=UPI003F18F027
MSQGNFFAIGADEFNAACELGINPAVALLVMARGTGRDNVTTAWSALSVFTYSGMARRRAQEAIEKLVGAGLAEVLQAGKKPRYKLHRPSDDASLLWLPNQIISGAGDEIPPITKLRESGNLTLLQKFILLYGIQDLDNDGGLPRDVAWMHFQRELICPVGPFMLYGFNRINPRANSAGPLADLGGIEDEDGNKGAWTVLTPMLDMGLLEWAYYMAESEKPDAELIYPAGPYGTEDAIDSLIYWLEETGGKGYAAIAQSFDRQGIALKHIKNATMVGLLRLHYRPKTGKTSRWFALENERAEAMVGVINQICNAQMTRSVHIKAVQGF